MTEEEKFAKTKELAIALMRTSREFLKQETTDIPSDEDVEIVTRAAALLAFAMN